MDFSALIEEYSEAYCEMLEMAYGKGMMSEGGHEAIDAMFTGINIHGLTALEIGFGLGGAMFHLADKFQMQITGLEINPRLVSEAKQKTPQPLAAKLNFELYDPNKALPFDADAFDLVYSKGVLVHLEDKLPLFEDIFRVLKPGGYLVINDWLSPVKNKWGERIQTMCEREHLTLVAETPGNYQQLLKAAGFAAIKEKDRSLDYARYNREVIKRLQKNAEVFVKKYSQELLDEFIDSYELIAEANEAGELLETRFQAQKPHS